jgi:hypothetical protein
MTNSLCTSIAADLTSGEILPLQQVKELVLHTNHHATEKKRKKKKHMQQTCAIDSCSANFCRKQEVP